MGKIDNEERIATLKEGAYQELFGVKNKTFEAMRELVKAKYEEEHRRGGKPPSLTSLDQLIIMLCYYREYRTMQHIAFDYGVGKTAVYDAIHWTENVLVRSGKFSLPKKKEALGDVLVEVVFVDTTEIAIERPKKQRSNRELARRRIFIKHVNCRLKVFKILSTQYRNKCRDLQLRVSLICGIYNFQLG